LESMDRSSHCDPGDEIKTGTALMWPVKEANKTAPLLPEEKFIPACLHTSIATTLDLPPRSKLAGSPRSSSCPLPSDRTVVLCQRGRPRAAWPARRPFVAPEEV
jgi:hypothetical protein